MDESKLTIEKLKEAVEIFEENNTAPYGRRYFCPYCQAERVYAAEAEMRRHNEECSRAFQTKYEFIETFTSICITVFAIFVFVMMGWVFGRSCG